MELSMGAFNVYDRNGLSNFMGLTIGKPSFTQFFTLNAVRSFMGYDTYEQFLKIGHRVAIINSFWGLSN